MNECKEYPAIISGIEKDKDVVVIILSASRVNEQGERVSVTDGQKDAAMNAAKATLQCIGAEVLESSTALLIPALDLEEGNAARLMVNCKIEGYAPAVNND